MRNGHRNRKGNTKGTAEQPVRVERGSGNVFADLGFSNPDLVPETAHNFETALRYFDEKISAGLVAYRNRVRDQLITPSRSS